MCISSYRLPLVTLALFFLLLGQLRPADWVANSLPLQSAPQTPRAARIALLHMYDSVSFFQRLGKLTGENKARYAKRHGYDMIYSTPQRTTGILKRVECALHGGGGSNNDREVRVYGPRAEDGSCWMDDTTFDIDHSRAPTFGKIKLALAACNGRAEAWLLWSDADAMVVNQSVRLETIIDDAYDIIFSYDWLMLNAGMLLVKCSHWSLSFLQTLYNNRKFDSARALDQSALQEFIDNLTATERRAHIKIVPKYALDTYTEEYRPGDFLLHFAGKLYEATEPGLFAIANQFDILSMVDDVEDITAFFRGRHLLNYYSGVCKVQRGERQSHCSPDDPRRIILNESLGSMSMPNRYRHVGLRYYWLGDWTDKYDVPGWHVFQRKLLIEPRGASEREFQHQQQQQQQQQHPHPLPPPAAHHDGGFIPAKDIADDDDEDNDIDGGQPVANNPGGGITQQQKQITDDVDDKLDEDDRAADKANRANGDGQDAGALHDGDGDDTNKNDDDDTVKNVDSNSRHDQVPRHRQDGPEMDSGFKRPDVANPDIKNEQLVGINGGANNAPDNDNEIDDDDDRPWAARTWLLMIVGVAVSVGAFITLRQRKKMTSKTQ